MATSVKSMMETAGSAVKKIDVDEARRLMAEEDALVVDVREGPEVHAGGKVKGAHHVPRGTLEFKADPEATTHDAAFRTDRPIVVYCASGGRAALAGQTLQQMGYDKVYNLGGFKDWAEAGGETEDVSG